LCGGYQLDWDSKWIVGTTKFDRDRLTQGEYSFTIDGGLCKECHAMQDAISIKNKFDNAGKWFGKIMVGISRNRSRGNSVPNTRY
jgi:hypothetical protein